MAGFFDLPPGAQTERLTALGHDALTHWGLGHAALTPIKVRENAVFEVVAPGGARYALRIHRAGYHSDRALSSEIAWMRALSGSGIDVPEVLPTRDGADFVVVGDETTGGARQIDLFAWIAGTPLGTSEAGVAMDDATLRDVYAQLGALAARVHTHAERWQRPVAFERHAWDAEGLVGEQPFWGRFWELAALSGDDRRTIEAVRDALREDLGGLSTGAATYGLIHADFVPENVMVEGGRVKLIDFDDAGEGWHMFELATALVFLWGEPTFDTARDALVAGYRTERALPDEVLATLPTLLMARATTYLGWVHTRSETQTARELTGPLVELNLAMAERYLTAR